MAPFPPPALPLSLKRKYFSGRFLGNLAVLSVLILAVAGIVRLSSSQPPAEARPLLPALLAPDPVKACVEPSILPRTKAIAPLQFT